MILDRYYLECLSHASYLIGDQASGRAIVVDPRRDVAEYLTDAADRGLRIVGVIDTHFHADFVAGHLELAAATGAWIGYGRHAEVDFEFRPLAHGEHISLGEVDVEVLETPGHTWESISLLVRERADAEPHAVLTGDSMFIGDVGRPDLAAAAGCSPDELARAMYRTIHDVLLRLPDATLVMPAHGAGSACGKNLSTELVSTIGAQRVTNVAAQPMGEEAFVAMVTAGQPPAPAYFTHSVRLNGTRHPLFAPESALPALGADRLRAALADGASVIDSRSPETFAAGHLRGAYNDELSGRFAETAGMIADDAAIVVVADPGHQDETRTRLARIGYDRVVGYLPEAVVNSADLADLIVTGERIDVDAVRGEQAAGATLLDVRNPGETEQGTIDGATLIPLPQLAQRRHELPTDRRVVVYCASGRRSSVAASYLRAHGVADVCDVRGGYNAWSETHQPAAV